MATLNPKLQIKPGQRLGVLYPPPGIFETLSGGWLGIRMVALDDTWSAMHFRPAELVGK